MRKTTCFFALALLALATPAMRPAFAAEGAAGTPWLGVYTQTVDERLRDAMDLTSDGALVSRVVEDSPAERAGVRKGDIIIRFASQPVESSDELVRLVREASVGQTITIEVRRGDQTRVLTARLDARPVAGDAPQAERRVIERPKGDRRVIIDAPDGDDDGDRRVVVRKQHALRDGDAPKAERRIVIRRPGERDLVIEGDDMHGLEGLEGLRGLERLRDLPEMKGFHWSPEGPGGMAMGLGRGRLGVRVQDLNPQLGEYFEVPDGRGALVMEVMKDTPAERVGLQAGDIITRVDDQSIEDPSDLIETLRGKEGKVTVTVVRKGRTLTLEPELGQATPRRTRMGTGEDRLAPEAPDAPEGSGTMRDELRELRQELRELPKELESTRRK